METVRAATILDIEALDQLVNSAYRGDSSRAGWTTEADLLGGQRTDPDSLRELIAIPGNVVLLLFNGENLIGCVFLQKKSDRGYLGMLTVQPTMQAGGIGKRLMGHAEAFVKNQWKLPIMEMQVIIQRGELIAWYERRGYSRTGENKPFPYGDAKFGLPRVENLEFTILEKRL